MIGNSSAGIVESSFLNKTSINIGSRQKGKVIPNNVLNVQWKEKDILSKINILKYLAYPICSEILEFTTFIP